MKRVLSAVALSFSLLVSAASVNAAPDGRWGNRATGSPSMNLSSKNAPVTSNPVQMHCNHPQGPRGDGRVPVTPVPPPVVIVDPVRPVPPVVRDHRQPTPPVVRDHRVQGSPKTTQAPPVVPRASEPWRGGNVNVGQANGGVTVGSVPRDHRNDGVENITGTTTVEGIGSELWSLGSGVVDFFTPDLGEVPPNRDHRTNGSTLGGNTRDHRN